MNLSTPPSDFPVLIASKLVQLLKRSQIQCRTGGSRASGTGSRVCPISCVEELF